MVEELTERKRCGGQHQANTATRGGRRCVGPAKAYWRRGNTEEPARNELPALDGRVDTVLAALWDNPADAAYDNL
jgi:hypothetical protein